MIIFASTQKYMSSVHHSQIVLHAEMMDPRQSYLENISTYYLLYHNLAPFAA
jgi:hypothetical protein